MTSQIATSQTVAPALSGIVVHWRNERELAELFAAWPRDSRFELIVVDNGSTAPFPELPAGARRLEPQGNLGFAGGVNAGLAASRGEIVLLLNPDARPEPGALEALLAGFAARPDAAGLAPRLLGDDGTPQFRWQLRALPNPWRLLLQAFFLPGKAGPEAEPAAETAVEQPAACALALRRDGLVAAGGMDPSYFPAWFEDVDLAARLRARGAILLYWPAARFRHGLGASVARLGYGRFLWVYSRNLERYLRRHHGAFFAAVARLLIPIGALGRLLALPLRRPRRAESRSAAAVGLLATAAGAISGWRWPQSWANELSPRTPAIPGKTSPARR